MAKKTTAIKYSDAIREIEQILEKFRSEQLDVDTLAQEVKRATELIAACKSRLKEVEGEVNKILEA
ncbi:MAG: exodeoxyribonuclease VII small subunit [Alistipes sp.]|nr:exodeoxyribonuclease VII small subunit [Alistipes sp.]MBQ1979296.1 exodeoxyribonuclease VII small subunit [Alistipes sp.]MBQ5654107.1 exodeoxyribonuclease VII small subunit [Alistipes sp.]